MKNKSKRFMSKYPEKSRLSRASSSPCIQACDCMCTCVIEDDLMSFLQHLQCCLISTNRIIAYPTHYCCPPRILTKGVNIYHNYVFP